MTLRVASIIALCILLSDGANISYNEAKSTYSHEIGENTIKEMCKSIKFLKYSLNCTNGPSCDLLTQKPDRIARYVVNQADWGTVATINVQKKFQGWPSANLISIADGPVGEGTGIPYMYLTPFDRPAQDLKKNHKASLEVSLAQGDYCKAKEYDAMDPRCSRVMLTGTIIAVKNETQKETVQNFFFDRHPKLRNMPPSHNFFFAEFKIQEVALLYTFGGHKIIPVEDYLNSNSVICEDSEIESPFVYKSIV